MVVPLFTHSFICCLLEMAKYVSFIRRSSIHSIRITVNENWRFIYFVDNCKIATSHQNWKQNERNSISITLISRLFECDWIGQHMEWRQTNKINIYKNLGHGTNAAAKTQARFRKLNKYSYLFRSSMWVNKHNSVFFLHLADTFRIQSETN